MFAIGFVLFVVALFAGFGVAESYGLFSLAPDRVTSPIIWVEMLGLVLMVASAAIKLWEILP